MIPTTYQLPAIALLIIGGVIAWAAGYRLFRFVLTLFGFYAGAVVATMIVGPVDTTLLIIAALGGGAVGALIMFFGYFVGVALVGAAVGALTVQLIWSRFGTDPHAFVTILGCVAGAAAAMALQRYVIIFATAFLGGWTLLWGAMNMMSATGSLAQRPPVWMIYPFDLSPSRRWILLAWLVVGILGVFIQMKFTGRAVAFAKAKSKPAKKT